MAGINETPDEGWPVFSSVQFDDLVPHADQSNVPPGFARYYGYRKVVPDPAAADIGCGADGRAAWVTVVATDTRPKDMPYTHMVRDTSGVLRAARLGSDVEVTDEIPLVSDGELAAVRENDTLRAELAHARDTSRYHLAVWDRDQWRASAELWEHAAGELTKTLDASRAELAAERTLTTTLRDEVARLNALLTPPANEAPKSNPFREFHGDPRRIGG